MIVSREISIDILQYLQNKKEMSIIDIAAAMGASPDFIELAIKNKLKLTSEHINTYLKNTNTHFWEFALEVIPANHLSEKAKNRISLCKDIANHIKKKKESS